MIKNMLITTAIILILFFTFTILYYNHAIKKECTQDKSICKDGYICNFKTEKCVKSEKCSDVKPEFCITLYDPVCSNGKEYSNNCFACMENITFYYKGTC